MAIEIVDFPWKMVIFHCYVSSPVGIIHDYPQNYGDKTG